MLDYKVRPCLNKQVTETIEENQNVHRCSIQAFFFSLFFSSFDSKLVECMGGTSINRGGGRLYNGRLTQQRAVPCSDCPSFPPQYSPSMRATYMSVADDHLRHYEFPS